MQGITEECFLRLKMLGKHGNINGGHCYLAGETIRRAENTPNPEEFRKARQATEKKIRQKGGEPYYMMFSETTAGKYLHALYVTDGTKPDAEERWEEDRADLTETTKKGGIEYRTVRAYTYNMTAPEKSGYGLIGVTNDFTKCLCSITDTIDAC